VFRILATITSDPKELLELHPAEIAALLEQAWNKRRRENEPPGHPSNRSTLSGLQVNLPNVDRPAGTTIAASVAGLPSALDQLAASVRPGGLVWPHLIYAYMIENTRVFEVFRRVISEFVHGEKLGVPDAAALNWIRSTEEYLYREPPPFTIHSVTSEVRRDMRAVRRNAYQRMFGMDLNHGADDNSPYPYTRSDNANSEFVSTFEELLREVWVGITHVNNETGSRPTDDAKLATLAEALHNMLVSRRQGGNLSREEFVAVSMLSWLHLTVELDAAPIVVALRAQASSSAERLFKIASQVGLPAHGHANSYFRIAEPLSSLLILIETGILNQAGEARALYDPNVVVPGPIGSLPSIMGTIITHWSTITGRDMKAGKVAAG
jgi:hypothetical protein